MTIQRTGTHIIVMDAGARHAVSLDDEARDMGGHEAGTYREALAGGTAIWCVDDTARRKSSYGMHGALYVGDCAHEADHRVE